jgi:hypothetical protein
MADIVNKEYHFFKWCALRGFVYPDKDYENKCSICGDTLEVWHSWKFSYHFKINHPEILAMWGLTR